MLVNADFSRRAIVTPDQYEWIASPQPGVERVMLDRVGAEQARATSIVRYAPGSRFPHHQHPGGEEILVLSGTLSDDSGHHPAGWYLRNPPGSSHRTFSEEGAVILVKLRQMAANENQRMSINAHDPACWRREADRDVCMLFSNSDEHVCLQRVPPGHTLFAASVERTELLVLAGEMAAGGQRCERGSWIRLPAGDFPVLTAGAQGATFYCKTGSAANGPAEALA